MFKNDNFEDLRRQEAYEKQKQVEFARGFGSLLYNYLVYSITWLLLSAFTSIFIRFLTGMHEFFSTIFGMIIGAFLFKIPYIKQHPLKSLATGAFLMFLLNVAFPENS